MKKGQLKVKAYVYNKNTKTPNKFIKGVSLLKIANGYQMIVYMKSKQYEVSGSGGSDKEFVVDFDCQLSPSRKTSTILEIQGLNFNNYLFLSKWRKSECHLFFLDNKKMNYKFVENKKLKTTA